MSKNKMVQSLQKYFVVFAVIFLGFISPAIAADLAEMGEATRIEWLKFAVPVAEQPLFIEKETEIWDPLDRRSPAYLGKEVWRNPKNPDELIVVVRWRAGEVGIPKADVKQAEQDFNMAVGKEYDLLEKDTFLVQPS